MKTHTTFTDAMTVTPLDDHLQQLREELRSPAWRDGTELAECLRAVRESLTEHFRLEEEDGYMDAVRKDEPRLDRPFQNLLAEHGRLLTSLDELLKEAESVRHRSGPLQEKVRAWMRALRDHESRENDLVEDAVKLDIGAED